jgi:glycosyltransferase involved in cell wall biosynthesis
LAIASVDLPDRPAPAPPSDTGDGLFRVCLTGNLGYFPTAHGASWFLDEVWPKLRARLPQARMRLAGARPTRQLRTAARRAGAELVVDPPDIAAELARADAAVAPLFAGSGVPVKLLEALAAGVPVVATPWAAAGLEPELAARIRTGDSAEAWANALVETLTDRTTALARASETRTIVRRLHSSERLSPTLNGAIAAG